MKQQEKSFNFTKKALDTLVMPETGKRFYFYDTKVRGLELMITEQGSKSFKVYRKCNGKPVRVTLGKYSEMSIENARNEAQRVITEMINGKNRNEEKKKIRAEITFGEIFEMFMEKYSKIYKKSWKYDEREVNRFLKHWFKRKVSDISR